MAEGKKYRYPGINPFETGDTDIFFGRDEDRRKLADLVEVEKSTLLYSRSGLGKSSLLKAALIPELTIRGYQTFYIRLGLCQNDSLPPVQTILRRTVLAEQKGAPVTFLHKFVNRTNSLWSVFKAAQITSYPAEKPIVLLFDQFEEIGSYRNYLNDFKRQLAELLYTAIPQEYLEALSDDDLLTDPLTDAELDILYKPLRIKAVFSIRSDQLSVVNGLSDFLPNILKVHYELKPLSVAQARKAIEEPGRKEGNFVTPAFLYYTDAVDKIIHSLDQKGKNEIDTAQLQIVLQYVEQDIVEKQDDTDISAADLGDLNDVYRNYYRNSLQKLENEQHAAEELIEDTLIAEGRRISYDEALCRKRVCSETLDALIRIRLLRQEPNTMGGYSYEISHDSLVEPILQTREERKRKEEEDAQKAAFEAQLTEQHKKTAQQRALLYVALAAVLLSSGFCAWAVIERNRANTARDKVNQTLQQVQFQTKNAQIALDKYIQAEIERIQIEKSHFQMDIRTYYASNDQDLIKQTNLQIDSLNQKIKNLQQNIRK